MSHNPELISKVKNLPHVPGVYMFLNSSNEIIYVGKAKNLHNRVGSYFATTLPTHSKTYALVQSIVDLKYIEVSTEFEALILEAELIKKYDPKYNINLKDDKSYLYIVIRFDGSKKDSIYKFPRIITARKSDLLPGDRHFGPYPDATSTRHIVRTLRRLIPFRDCTITKFLRYKTLGKPCLYGHLGLCTAPCIDKITPELYKADIAKIAKILTTGSGTFIRDLHTQMRIASKNQDFELATKYRDLLTKFEYVSQSFRSPDKYIENPNLIEDTFEMSLMALVDSIPDLKSLPRRIECYDISNISGKEAVGSMVVAINGRITPKNYKRFKIKSKNDPDDFGMMREVLTRRINRGKEFSAAESPWELPDLLVVDGGKGQVSAALDVFKELDVHIPLIGLAKRLETIVYVDGSGDFKEVVLDRTNEGLKLLQRLRDEAHRFAQAYHHLLRTKRFTKDLRSKIK